MDNQNFLHKRYAYKLFGNLCNLIANVIIFAIVPKALGPKIYGDYNFVTDFFSKIVSFFDMGTSTAYYNKLCQRQKDFGIIKFYLGFVIVVTIFVVMFSLSSNLLSIRHKIWPGQQPLYIILAAFFALLTWFVQLAEKTTDAFGITVEAEKKRIIQKIISVIVILLIFFLGKLSFLNFFIYQYIILLFFLVLLIKMIALRTSILEKIFILKYIHVKQYAKEFYSYSHPLIVYGMVGLITGIFDRWILQVYGDSIQQGFFGLAYSVGAVCFLFTSAFTPLIMREFSVASEKDDKKQLADDFRKYVPFFYAATACVCCFISVGSRSILYIFGGEQYGNAFLVLVIMSLYPIHQTYGQLSGAVFYATGKTQIYRNIGVFFMLIGIPAIYILIAPRSHFGLNAGAAGLAIKMVLLQFFIVNVHLWYNSKYLKFDFWRYFKHQIGVLIIFFTIAICASLFTSMFVKNQLFKLLISGLVYAAVVFGIVFKFPIILGLKKQHIYYVFEKIRKNYYISL
jgi:O-antigen/teichoic acid export membrane protein